ncbi:O-antigen ligase family protein [Lactobacillus delbrueckii subsp. bulgaricus]|nr:hypothetical protein [Lactobacillus delbrueckii subsp. bulgaricus]
MTLKKTHLAVATLLLMWILTDTQKFGNVPLGVMLIIFLIYGENLKFAKLGNMEKAILLYIGYTSFITLYYLNINPDVCNSLLLIIEYFISLLISNFLSNKVNIPLFLKDMGSVGGFLGLLGCIEGIVRYPIWHHLLSGRLNIPNIGTSDYRTAIIFDYPIVCGGFLLFFLLCNILLPIKNNFFRYISIIGLFLAIVLNNSRSAWISLAFVLVLILFKHLHFKRTFKARWLVIIVVALLSVFLIDAIIGVNLFTLLRSYIYSRFSGMLDAGEGQIIRIETVEKSISYWMNGNLQKMFFGGGKNYDKVFLSMYPVVKGGGAFVWNGAIDNQYITIIHESGLIGLLLILYVAITAFKRLLCCDKDDNVAMLINGSILSWAVVIYFYEAFNYPFVFLMIVTLCSMSDRWNSEETNYDEYFKEIKQSR